MKLTKQQLKSLIKEEIRISEAGITPKKGPLIALAAGGGLLAMAGLTVIGAPVAAGALAGAGFVSNMLKDSYEELLGSVNLRTEQDLANFIHTAMMKTAEGVLKANKVEPTNELLNKAKAKMLENRQGFREFMALTAQDIRNKMTEVCSEDASGVIQKCAVKGFDYYYEEGELKKALEEKGIGSHTSIIIKALRDNNILVRKQALMKRGMKMIGMASEAKIRQTTARKVGLPLATFIGGAIGGAAGGFVGNLPGAVTGAVAGGKLGQRAFDSASSSYDKYLLRKVATEDDIVAAALASRENSEDWNVEEWFSDSLSKLTDEQKSSVIYEKHMFMAAGEKYSDVEMAEEISSLFEREGMLDTDGDGMPQLPAPQDEPAQIEMSDDLYDDDAMVAESLRFKKLAGILKE